MSLTTTTNHTQGVLFRDEHEVFGEVMDYLTEAEKFNVAVTSKSNGRLYFNVYVKSGMSQLAKIIEKTYQTLPALSRFTFNFSMGEDLGVSELFRAKFEARDFALDVMVEIPKENVQERKAIENSRICLGNADLYARLQEFPEVGGNQEVMWSDWDNYDDFGGDIKRIKELVFDCMKRGEFKLAEKIASHHIPYYQGRYFTALADVGITVAKGYAYSGKIDKALAWFYKFRGNERSCSVENGATLLFKAAIQGGQVEGACLIKNLLPGHVEYSWKEALRGLTTKHQVNLLKKAVSTGNNHMISEYIKGIPELVKNTLFYQTWVACGRPSEPQFGEKAFFGLKSNIQGEELQLLRQQVLNLVSTSPNISIYHSNDVDKEYLSKIKEAIENGDSVEELLQDPSHQVTVALLYDEMAKLSGREGDLEFGERAFKSNDQRLSYKRRQVVDVVLHYVYKTFTKSEKSLKPSTFV